jgi:hypothetical protein
MHYDPANQVQIILTGTSLNAARKEVRKNKAAQYRKAGKSRIGAALQAYRETRDFKGPRFQSNASTKLFVAVGAATVNVGVHSGGVCQEYVYPLSTVGRVRITAND